MTEQDWTDVDKVADPYIVSKTLAEKAAWRLAQEPGQSRPVDLTTILPSLMLGPVFSKNAATSLELAQAMFDIFRVPLTPDLLFHTVDVRDVAAAHVLSLTAPEAKNK